MARDFPARMKKTARPFQFLLGLFALLPVSIGFSLVVGSVSIPVTQWWDILSGSGDPIASQIVWDLRFPRAMAAVIVGGLLGMAGVLMQALLRNPLADPYVLGVSSGAAVMALFALFIGTSAWWLPLFAMAGALGSVLLVFLLATAGGGYNATRLLLTGVIVASGCSAFIALMLSLASNSQLRGMIFWLMGDLSDTSPSLYMLLALVVGVVASLWHAGDLNQMLRGETIAASLGVDTKKIRYFCYFTASAATALAVSIAGSIGFVGLLVPHAVRMIIGSDHRYVLPSSALLGGIFLLWADTCARTLLAPEQIPVGVLTAVLGVPAFLWLLHRGHRSWP